MLKIGEQQSIFSLFLQIDMNDIFASILNYPLKSEIEQ